MKISKNIRLLAMLLPLTLRADDNFTVALIGDMPYGAAAEPQFERVIADINRYEPEFTAHIGDTKSGSTLCNDAHYAKVLNWFNSFRNPLIYSVGDNEWTDCLRANNGGFDPLGRLALVRSTFFQGNFSLGRDPIRLTRQSDDRGFELYRENAMWVKGPALFATIHAPGSNNNLEYRTVQGAPNPFYDNDREFTARNAANLAWLHKAFALARQKNLRGVMILTQANMFETFMDTSTGSTHSGFADFMAALRSETQQFSGEVVMVSGDSHYMRVDKPLTDVYPACASATGDCLLVAPSGTRILNFTRVEVPGSADVHWVRCRVNEEGRNVFQFEFMIVPGNH